MVFLAATVLLILAMPMLKQQQKSQLLVVSVAEIRHTDTGYVIRGNIKNFSENTYSVPDLMFVFKTESGAILNQIVQLPPSGLIEPRSDMQFLRRVEPKVPNAKRISVRFVEN